MSDFSLLLQRASLFGLAALFIALVLQWVLSDRVPAAWRVWIWRVALIQSALALVPLAPIALSVLPARAPIAAPQSAPVVEAPSAQEPIVPETAPVQAPPVAAPESAPLVETMPLRETPAAPSAPASQANGLQFQLGWRELLVWVYALGIAAQLLLLARNARRVRRTLRACTPLDDARLSVIAARLNVAKTPRLLQSEGGAPFLTGILRPTIVLPATLDETHLEAVLTHELAHLRRRDLAWNLLLWALQSALWFHPLSWLSRRFHALEVESACDELTLRLTQIAPKSYGALLISAENSQASPLAAGVNDNLFALQTRLKRLGRAPIQPRRRAAWLLGAALLLSFAALVPLRLTARAQSENEVASQTASQTIGGAVRDVNGKIVAGATVYVMSPLDNGGNPLAQGVSDAKGIFAINDVKADNYGLVLFVDAGKRGVAEKSLPTQRAAMSKISIALPHTSNATLLFLNARQRPVRNLAVRLRKVGESVNSWMAMPREVRERFRATTDEMGLASFPPLPLGMRAEFALKEQISKPTKFGLGDLRGVKWAPLAAEDSLMLDGQDVLRSINLVPPIRLEGRVTLPDGGAKGNVLILARRINAAEAAGNDAAREQLIGQTRSNATGQYVMDGLRPGRYYVWVYPEKSLMKDYAGAGYVRDLKAPVNRVDFQLSRGAIIQGVVISKATKKPVKGQTMWLFDSQENNQYVITDARGYFKFRALGGKQRLRVHENGSNSPPPGFILPAQSEFNFTVKNGEKREFKIELPGKAIGKNTAGVSGSVLGPDGRSAANATVVYRVIGDASGELKTMQSDKDGRFTLAPPYSQNKPLQLWADAGDLTTLASVVATRGQKVTLQLKPEAWASLAGQIVDKNKKPLAGAKLTQFVLIDNNGINARQATSDAAGRFRFERVRPGVGSLIYSDAKGYTNGESREDLVKPGQRIVASVTVQRASQTLSGIVYDEAGQLAKGYQVWATGQRDINLTRPDGKFYTPQVLDGPIYVTVTAPRGGRSWNGFKFSGGDKDIVIRLSEANRAGRNSPFANAEKIDPVALIGKPAPSIQAVRWSNGKALSLASLRGQTVLLAFDFFGRGGQTAIRDVARSQGARFQTIGVQLSLEGVRDELGTNEIARQMGFPIAVDAALPTKKLSGWQTFSAYGEAQYAVIARDGTIVYAGDQLDRAIELATAK